MSSSTPGLLLGLVDDAAVFPPGNSPLPGAVTAHAAHRRAPYAAAVGPLLVPASSAGDLLAVLDDEHVTGPEPLVVTAVARPGTAAGVLRDGIALLRSDPRVHLAGAELGWSPHWRRLDLPGDLPLALEVAREPEARDAALADIRTSVAEGDRVLAKFRTGPTPAWPWPDEDELAGFLCAATAAPVPFKLTGGLHHAVRGRYVVDGVPEENHGVLDVLVATQAALDGAAPTTVASLLAVPDAGALVELVTTWSDGTTGRVRAAFTSYGCCTVTDPVTELADLGLTTAA